MSKPKLMASSLLAAAFAVGVIVGGAGSAFADARSENTKSDRPTYAEWLQAELDLQPYQRASIDGFTEQFQAAMDALWAEQVRPRVQDLRQSTRAEIASVLDEEQRELFQRLNDESDRKRAERQKNDEYKP